ncbi:RNA polymerase sigma factor (sigma-70 family) [Variovorax sp. GrIS 2.14]|uniref:RNA polymerase sigma factor n=1 Tax=Variovorax sp. GrIS 2.14 TaxID=3071709 RepID=UPI0038F6853D
MQMEPLRIGPKAHTERDEQLVHLVHQVAAGDMQAFRDLYELSRVSLYYCALKIVRRRELAEDVMQEAFLTIWRLAPEFAADRGSVLAWMMVITRSRAIDSLRGRITSRESMTFAFEANYEETIPSDQPYLASALDVKRLSEAARRHVSELKTTERTVLRLAFLSDMSHSEVALHTAMPIGTVKRAGPGNLNNPVSVETAPAGEDLACEDWSKDEQKTPPHALSGIQSQGGVSRCSRRQDAGRIGASA